MIHQIDDRGHEGKSEFLRNADFLRQCDIMRVPSRTFQYVASAVTKSSRRWDRECSRIEPARDLTLARRQISVLDAVRKPAGRIGVRGVESGIGGRKELAAFQIGYPVKL